MTKKRAHPIILSCGRANGSETSPLEPSQRLNKCQQGLPDFLRQSKIKTSFALIASTAKLPHFLTP
jgi:hypothetical protein